MDGEKKRKLSALGLAVLFHVFVAAGIGTFVYIKNREMPPGTIEVTMVDSSGKPIEDKEEGGGGGGSTLLGRMENLISGNTSKESESNREDNASGKPGKEEKKEGAPSSDRGPVSSESSPGDSGNSSTSSSGGNEPGNGDSSSSGNADGGDNSSEASGSPGPGFIDNGDGTYTAPSADGIDYTVLADANASYPEEARDIGYASEVDVTADLLVGLDGSVESVNILTSAPNLGFREEAERAFWNMRFAPVYYNGVNIKMHFQKTIRFMP